MFDTDVNILIVDDMAPMRSILTQNLKKLGFNFIKAVPSASEAMQVLNTQPITLVLSDWNMPEMTGLELLKWIRQESASHKFTPVIMVTAELHREQVTDAIASGVTDFILKPFSLKDLSDRIQRALAAKKSMPASTASERVVSPADKQITLESFKKTDKKLNERLFLLVVDDTPLNLSLVEALFQEEYRVMTATDGAQAVKICESEDPPHLVLLDIMMPNMDGYEVLRHLKANETTAQIPIIFMTSLTDAESIVKGLDAGAVDYILKPIVPSIMRARVKNFLRYHRGYEELRDTLDTMMDNAQLREDVEHIVRHDLKGPLSAIIGLVSQGRSEKNISMENAKMIEESAYMMLHMISLSTDLYKMETGRFSLDAKPVDIERLTLKVAEEVRSAFAAKNLSIVSNMAASNGEPGPSVSGDELLCYSLLHNLIKNAAEASPVNGAITFNKQDNDLVKITIHNDGAVPEPVRDRFFEKFVTMGKKGGTGLGTYSARLITEAQQGSIAMQTSDKDGTTIEISLPKWTDNLAANEDAVIKGLI